MKRLALTAIFVLGTCASLAAQQSSFLQLAPATQPTAAPAASSFNFTLVPSLAPPASNSALPVLALSSSAFAASAPSAPPASAFPAPSPAPQYPGSSGEDYYKWDLAIGYEYIHFNSVPYNLNLSGLHTDLTYNVKNWFGLEGNVISAWGGVLSGVERSKYVLFTGGARISSGPSRRRWTPWAHALVGGAHLNPQVARESKTGFAVQAGGGVDWTYNTRVSLRGEGDYIRTQLFSSSQNNFQIGLGAVIHF